MKFTRIIVLLFFLPFSTWSGTFLETFDDGNLEDWQELNVHDAVQGTWEILDGELEAINPGGSARLLTTRDETWQDYSIEINVKPLKKPGPGKIGIAARIKGTWMFWCGITDLVLNDPESKVICYSRDVHTDFSELFYISPHPLLKLNKWSRLKLSVNGNHFIFWINGKKIVEVGDPFILHHDGQDIKLKTQDLSRHPPEAGAAGFGFSNYIVRFDNITITGEGIPDKGRLSVLPLAKLATTWGDLKRF